MTYKQAVIKQRIEFILIYPIVLLGKIYGRFKKPARQYSHFLFFPSADIGGSVKVNADITECIKEAQPLIIFSKQPKNNKFLALFNIEGVDHIDLSKKIDNKLYHFVNIFYRGVLASWIDAANSPVVFGGESLYFYKVIPHIKNSVKVIELCHLNTWFNYTQAFIKRIDIRIFSTPKIKRDAASIYTANHLPEEFYDKLFFVDNKIDIPPYMPIDNKILQVLFVGRGAPQKRVHLLVSIAKKIHEKDLPVHFTFVGDVIDFFDNESRRICTLLGEIKEKKELEAVYNKSDILMLTSAYEGLPLVVMDMMARGKIIIATSVDGIPDYITNGKTGLLIENTTEAEIVEKGVALIELILNNPILKKDVERQTYAFAKDHFGAPGFDAFYKKMLMGYPLDK